MFARLTNTFAAVALGAVASLALPVSPAAAQDGEIVVVRELPGATTRTEVVPHRDLNLRLVNDLEVLNERVERAVRKVCEDQQPLDTTTESFRNCAARAWAGARPQIHTAYLQANQLARR